MFIINNRKVSLKIMNRTIILEAGHSISDPGATTKETTEAKEAIKIRDKLIPLLSQDFNVEILSDNLDLKQSIVWVNKKFKNLDDGLALTIHLNTGGEEKVMEQKFFIMMAMRDQKKWQILLLASIVILLAFIIEE